MNRIPEFDRRAANEDTMSYGLRALAFAIRHDCTASLSLDAMEAALHASAVPVAATSCAVTLAALHDMRTRLMSMIKVLTADRTAAIERLIATSTATPNPKGGGAKVPRSPIVPNRPTPSAALPAPIAPMPSARF